MLTFKLINMERKEVARRLGELTGVKPVYTRIPRYAYEIGDYTIDRDCNLLVEEEAADKVVLQTLLDEEMIEAKALDSLCIREPATEELVKEPMNASMEKMSPDTVQDEAHEVATETPAEEAEDLDLAMEFFFPMSQHTGRSLRNLLNLIYSRSSLIRKATGGIFTVANGLMEAIKDDRCTYAIANFLAVVQTYEQEHGSAIEGLQLDREKVTFTGLPRAADVEHLRAYGQFAVLMNQQALHQKRIQAKSVDESNERYAMRTWLIRLGMNGDEFKHTRRILMENLSGSMAFRTQDQADRAKETLARQRAELKAQKAAAQRNAGRCEG